MKTQTRGLVYVAFGQEYDKLAAHTIAYSRKFTDLPICVITNLQKRHPKWNEVGDVEFKYVSMDQNENRQIKTSLVEYSPFEWSVFIDCDAVIQKKGIERVFDWLDNHDVAMQLNCVMEQEREGFWEIYTEMMRLVGEKFPLTVYSSAFLGFSKSVGAKRFFEIWNSYWKLSGKGRDMPALACAAKRTDAKIKVATVADKIMNREINVIDFDSIIHHRWLDRPGVKSFFEVFNIPEYKEHKPFDKKPSQVNRPKQVAKNINKPCSIDEVLDEKQWLSAEEVERGGKKHFTISDVSEEFAGKPEEVTGYEKKVSVVSENDKKEILFIVDSPNWAHDFKTDCLIRYIEDSFDIRKRYKNTVKAEDINSADLVVIYYWRELNDPNMKQMLDLLIKNRHKILMGICSHQEMYAGQEREKIIRFIKTLSKGVFVNSLLLHEEFSPCFDTPLFYAPNGVDTEFFKPALGKSLSEELRVGWAGSIANHGNTRGYHDFIVPAVNLVEGVELVTAAREEKWRDKNEMLEFYRSIDVYICASIAEGTPNPCLEAAACGVPLLTTRVGNMPELVQDDVNGFFIERDVNAIAEKLKQLRADRLLCERLGRNMLESIQQWDWSKQAENYREMFERMLSAQSQSQPNESTQKYFSKVVEKKDANSNAINCFLKARDEFEKENFQKACELMDSYRTSINYGLFPRTIRERNSQEIKVSIVIVTYNRTEDVRKCIESAGNQNTSRDEYEIIVVDNGQTDAEVIKPLCDQYIQSPANLYLSEGRNIGAVAARGRILAFLDDDALVGPEYVSSIKEAFGKYDIFGFRGRALPKTDPDANKKATGYNLGEEPFASYCNLEGSSAFLTDIYLAMNGMDPLLYGHEGSDLTYRIIKKYNLLNKIIYWPGTVIYHDDAPENIQKKKKQRYQRIEQYLKLKHDTNIFALRENVRHSSLSSKFDIKKQAQPLSKKTEIRNNSSDVPVALITYNRPKHTYEVLRALKAHDIKNIYIFSDAPKKQEDVENVSVIRKLARSVDWTEPVIIERTKNMGLARNIVSAIDYVFQESDRLILLEDDCVPQKYFFDFINTCLDKYRDNEKIFGVSGYTVQIPEQILKAYPYDLYFYPRIGSWGWATWKRAWQLREDDLRVACEKARKNNIDICQGGNDIPKMIDAYLKGTLKDVWTLHWVMTVYLNNGYYIYPRQSHVNNIGMDGSGVHVGKTSKFETKICDCKPSRFPDKVIVNEAIYNNFRKYYDVPGYPKTSLTVPEKISVNRVTELEPVSRSARGDDKPLKIVHVCAHDHGGAGKAAYRLNKALQLSGHDSSMLVLSKKTDDASVYIAKSSSPWEQVSLRNRKLMSLFPHRPAGLELYSDNFNVTDLATEPLIQQADVVNLHWMAGMLDYDSVSSALKGKTIVWTLHDMNPFTGGCHYAGDCEKYIESCGGCFQLGSKESKDLSAQIWLQKRRAYDDMKINVITPSQWLANCAKNSALFSDFNVDVIPNSLPLDVYKPYPKQEIRQSLNIDKDAKVILFGANSIVNERKGFKYLLEAVKTLELDSTSQICIVTFGGMPENVTIKSKYPVYNFGLVDNEADLAVLYSMADVFVLPSLEDNLPNIVLEAMACGTPVVGFEIGGIPDMVEHRKTGYLAKPKDIESLKEGIKWVLSKVSSGEDIERLCREKVERLYSPSVQAEAYGKLYRCLSEKPVQSDIIAKATNRKPDDEDSYLVSAIVSTYNSEEFIRGCLEDLENQTIADKLEIIVVNSGSQQNEEQIVKEFKARYDNIVYIKTEQREGLYTAWNRAAKAARGVFLTNANTDDRHRKDAFEIMSRELSGNPDIALVYGDQICTDTRNGTFDNHHVVEPAKRPEFSWQRLLFGCCVGSQPMWRKSLHNELGYFDETLNCAADWEFWLRIAKKYQFKHIPEFLGLYYHNEDGIEHGRKIHSLYERYIVGRKYGNPYISVIPQYTAKDNPLVSVIMPAYNSAKYIAESIESVLIQNYRNFELIIVDDGSTDDTKEVVSKFEDEKIRYFYQPNKGVSSARNLAIIKAKGQYIMPLDADDMMVPNFIATHLEAFDKNPDADLVYSDVLLINADSKPIRVNKKPEYKDRRFMIRDLFRAGHPIVPFRLGIRRRVFDKIGLYDESLIIGEDYDMMRRFVKEGLGVYHINSPMHLRRITERSLTTDNSSAQRSAAKIKCHFEVVRRYTDTFGYDELFPDVRWDRIVPRNRQMHAKCMLAFNYISLSQDYISSNLPEYAGAAIENAGEQLEGCLEIAPGNGSIRNLVNTCRGIKENLSGDALVSVKQVTM